jgi:outer membrane protein OmpA-like peptidoglycan-associated protein
VQVEQKINPDLGREENRRIKEEVLTRIDAMPALSQADKDKLHDSVRRARGMGRIITIPFAKGQSALSSKNIENLKTAVQAPEVAKLLEDPTVIFVVLGFADKKGDPNANLRLSRARADSALKALRTNCGILNVLHSVGMGGSDLFDAGDQARNRVVEVWAVLP